MHLNYPRLHHEPDSKSKSIRMALSPGRGTAGPKKRAGFCFFYNAATVMNPLVTVMHWAVVNPHKGTPCKFGTILT